jgi:serine/threonine-protein kinase RsbW
MASPESRDQVADGPSHDGESSWHDGESGLEQPFDGGGLVSLRGAVAAHGDRLGLSPERLDDLLLIAHEMASNAIRHGGGRGRLRLWRRRDEVFCRVEDWGRGLAAGLNAGREIPAPGAASGRGLWLIRQLADDVHIRTGPAGTAVTATVRLAGGLQAG